MYFFLLFVVPFLYQAIVGGSVVGQMRMLLVHYALFDTRRWEKCQVAERNTG